MPKIYKFYFLLFFSFPMLLVAQTDDNILWTKLGVQKAIDQKTTLFFAPIIRLNKDFSTYQNFSLDYTIRYKLNKNFAVQLTGRTWFLPNGTTRQFIWPDFLYKKVFQKWQAASLLRLHYALDIKEVADADFIRWKTTFTWLDFGKIQLSLGIEPWLRLNDTRQLQRVRYSTAAKYKFSDQFNIGLQWWRQETINLQPQQNVNIFVLGLSYTLQNRKKE
jgi:hypothetical protein